MLKINVVMETDGLSRNRELAVGASQGRAKRYSFRSGNGENSVIVYGSPR